MFAGHIGAALVIGRVDRRVNVGMFIAAALWLDILLWLFVLLGWESVSFPADFAHTHQAGFVFPYSHGLVASLAWSFLAGLAGFFGSGRLPGARLRAAALMTAAVFSHWLLDALVHKPELPLGTAGSTLVGLGLWRSIPAALAVESAIVAAGLLVFVPGCGLSRGNAIALTSMSLVVLAFTILGMTAAPAPPSALAMAASSLATVLGVCALGCRLGRVRGPQLPR